MQCCGEFAYSLLPWKCNIAFRFIRIVHVRMSLSSVQKVLNFLSWKFNNV